MSPAGDRLYGASYLPTDDVVVFDVASNGTLTKISETLAANTPVVFETDGSGQLLFTGTFSGIDVFSVSPPGVLSRVSGSPFEVRDTSRPFGTSPAGRSAC